jgi:hypothetical protein
LAILRSSARNNINLTKDTRLGLLFEGNNLSFDTAPLTTPLNTDHITAIAVGTHEGGIQPTNA